MKIKRIGVIIVFLLMVGISYAVVSRIGSKKDLTNIYFTNKEALTVLAHLWICFAAGWAASKSWYITKT